MASSISAIRLLIAEAVYGFAVRRAGDSFFLAHRDEMAQRKIYQVSMPASGNCKEHPEDRPPSIANGHLSPHQTSFHVGMCCLFSGYQVAWSWSLRKRCFRPSLLTLGLETKCSSSVLALPLAICATTLAAPIQAQTWPTKPIKLIVGYPPGGPVVNVMRLIAPAIDKELGQPLVIEVRPVRRVGSASRPR